MTLESFSQMIEKTESCWLWKGRLNKQGRAKVRFHNKEMNAARVAYILFIGPIPENHLLHHICKNKQCVNVLDINHIIPQKIELHEDCIGTINRLKTHCPKGHEYSKENTRKYFNKNHWYRVCITCQQN